MSNKPQTVDRAETDSLEQAESEIEIYLPL
jgi:hypothetical protein